MSPESRTTHTDYWLSDVAALFQQAGYHQQPRRSIATVNFRARENPSTTQYFRGRENAHQRGEITNKVQKLNQGG